MLTKLQQLNNKPIMYLPRQKQQHIIFSLSLNNNNNIKPLGFRISTTTTLM